MCCLTDCFYLCYTMKRVVPFLVSLSLAINLSAQSDGGCDVTPSLNKAVVSFVKNNIGKSVGRGECWDLAAEALKAASAKWDGAYDFGKKTDPKTECIYEGDIIQFENVELVYEKNKAFYRESMTHHTAVVLKVISKNKFIIADQNTRFSGKKVDTRELVLSSIAKGNYTFFRPKN